MNEELQKQMLEILKAMKEGVNPAWQELIQQRGTYCTSIGICHTSLAFLCIILMIALFAGADKNLEKDARGYLTDFGFAKAVSKISLAVVLFVVVGESMPKGFANLAEGAAPLGRLIEMLYSK